VSDFAWGTLRKGSSVPGRTANVVGARWRGLLIVARVF